ISVETKYFPSSRPSSPALVVQVTCLADSYMVWVGITDEPEENAGRATLQGQLGKDWVVAMPLETTGTQLLRSSNSDVALSIATRLARRYGKQIFLSVDVREDSGVLLEAEKAVFGSLKDIEEKNSRM
ncbi:hypothetical protein EDB86DRAFT_2805666, partial [Lactarius hatsudake]